MQGDQTERQKQWSSRGEPAADQHTDKSSAEFQASGPHTSRLEAARRSDLMLLASELQPRQKESNISLSGTSVIQSGCGEQQKSHQFNHLKLNGFTDGSGVGDAPTSTLYEADPTYSASRQLNRIERNKSQGLQALPDEKAILTSEELTQKKRSSMQVELQTSNLHQQHGNSRVGKQPCGVSGDDGVRLQASLSGVGYEGSRQTDSQVYHPEIDVTPQRANKTSSAGAGAKKSLKRDKSILSHASGPLGSGAPLSTHELKQEMISKAQDAVAYQERSLKHLQSALGDFKDASMSTLGKIGYATSSIPHQTFHLKKGLLDHVKEHKRTLSVEQKLIHIDDAGSKRDSSLSKVTQNKINERRHEAQAQLELMRRQSQAESELNNSLTRTNQQIASYNNNGNGGNIQMGQASISNQDETFDEFGSASKASLPRLAGSSAFRGGSSNQQATRPVPGLVQPRSDKQQFTLKSYLSQKSAPLLAMQAQAQASKLHKSQLHQREDQEGVVGGANDCESDTVELNRQFTQTASVKMFNLNSAQKAHGRRSNQYQATGFGQTRTSNTSFQQASKSPYSSRGKLARATSVETNQPMKPSPTKSRKSASPDKKSTTVIVQEEADFNRIKPVLLLPKAQVKKLGQVRGSVQDRNVVDQGCSPLKGAEQQSSRNDLRDAEFQTLEHMTTSLAKVSPDLTRGVTTQAGSGGPRSNKRVTGSTTVVPKQGSFITQAADTVLDNIRETQNEMTLSSNLAKTELLASQFYDSAKAGQLASSGQSWTRKGQSSSQQQPNFQQYIVQHSFKAQNGQSENISMYQETISEEEELVPSAQFQPGADTNSLDTISAESGVQDTNDAQQPPEPEQEASLPIDLIIQNNDYRPGTIDCGTSGASVSTPEVPQTYVKTKAQRSVEELQRVQVLDAKNQDLASSLTGSLCRRHSITAEQRKSMMRAASHKGKKRRSLDAYETNTSVEELGFSVGGLSLESFERHKTVQDLKGRQKVLPMTTTCKLKLKQDIQEFETKQKQWRNFLAVKADPSTVSRQGKTTRQFQHSQRRLLSLFGAQAMSNRVKEQQENNEERINLQTVSIRKKRGAKRSKGYRSKKRTQKTAVSMPIVVSAAAPTVAQNLLSEEVVLVTQDSQPTQTLINQTANASHSEVQASTRPPSLAPFLTLETAKQPSIEPQQRHSEYGGPPESIVASPHLPPNHKSPSEIKQVITVGLSQAEKDESNRTSFDASRTAAEINATMVQVISAPKLDGTQASQAQDCVENASLLAPQLNEVFTVRVTAGGEVTSAQQSQERKLMLGVVSALPTENKVAATSLPPPEYYGTHSAADLSRETTVNRSISRQQNDSVNISVSRKKHHVVIDDLCTSIGRQQRQTLERSMTNSHRHQSEVTLLQDHYLQNGGLLSTANLNNEFKTAEQRKRIQSSRADSYSTTSNNHQPRVDASRLKGDLIIRPFTGQGERGRGTLKESHGPRSNDRIASLLKPYKASHQPSKSNRCTSSKLLPSTTQYDSNLIHKPSDQSYRNQQYQDRQPHPLMKTAVLTQQSSQQNLGSLTSGVDATKTVAAVQQLKNSHQFLTRSFQLVPTFSSEASESNDYQTAKLLSIDQHKSLLTANVQGLQFARTATDFKLLKESQSLHNPCHTNLNTQGSDLIKIRADKQPSVDQANSYSYTNGPTSHSQKFLLGATTTASKQYSCGSTSRGGGLPGQSQRYLTGTLANSQTQLAITLRSTNPLQSQQSQQAQTRQKQQHLRHQLKASTTVKKNASSNLHLLGRDVKQKGGGIMSAAQASASSGGVGGTTRTLYNTFKSQKAAMFHQYSTNYRIAKSKQRCMSGNHYGEADLSESVQTLFAQSANQNLFSNNALNSQTRQDPSQAPASQGASNIAAVGQPRSLQVVQPPTFTSRSHADLHNWRKGRNKSAHQKAQLKYQSSTIQTKWISNHSSVARKNEPVDMAQQKHTLGESSMRDSQPPSVLQIAPNSQRSSAKVGQEKRRIPTKQQQSGDKPKMVTTSTQIVERCEELRIIDSANVSKHNSAHLPEDEDTDDQVSSCQRDRLLRHQAITAKFTPQASSQRLGPSRDSSCMFLGSNQKAKASLRPGPSAEKEIQTSMEGPLSSCEDSRYGMGLPDTSLKPIAERGTEKTVLNIDAQQDEESSSVGEVATKEKRRLHLLSTDKLLTKNSDLRESGASVQEIAGIREFVVSHADKLLSPQQRNSSHLIVLDTEVQGATMPLEPQLTTGLKSRLPEGHKLENAHPTKVSIKIKNEPKEVVREEKTPIMDNERDSSESSSVHMSQEDLIKMIKRQSKDFHIETSHRQSNPKKHSVTQNDNAQRRQVSHKHKGGTQRVSTAHTAGVGKHGASKSKLTHVLKEHFPYPRRGDKDRDKLLLSQGPQIVSPFGLVETQIQSNSPKNGPKLPQESPSRNPLNNYDSAQNAYLNHSHCKALNNLQRYDSRKKAKRSAAFLCVEGSLKRSESESASASQVKSERVSLVNRSHNQLAQGVSLAQQGSNTKKSLRRGAALLKIQIKGNSVKAVKEDQ